MPGPLNKGFVKGLHEQCAQIGITLADLGLLPVSLAMITNLSQQRAGRREHLLAHLPQRHGLAALHTAAGFYVLQGKTGGPFSSCRLMRARSHSFCAFTWAATG